MHSLDEIYRQIGGTTEVHSVMSRFFSAIADMDADCILRIIAQGITRANLPSRKVNLEEQLSNELGL